MRSTKNAESSNHARIVKWRFGRVDCQEQYPRPSAQKSAWSWTAALCIMHVSIYEGIFLMAKQKKRKLVPWSKDDVKNLRAFAKAKLSGVATAKKLRRTTGAVAQKAMKLGISFRSIKRKAK
jgi:hypothetical protein